MSFADTCLVRLSEIHTESQVFTADGDFYVYRTHGSDALDVLAP